ncbi:AMP-binding protein [Streptomyces sp. NPDC054863]
MTNLATDLKDAAARHPQRPAVRLDDGFLSLGALDELSARVAGGLLAHGVRSGDRVAVVLPNVPALPVLCFGILRVGATAVVANPRSDVRRLRQRGGHFGASLYFASHEAASQPASGARATCVPVGPGFLEQVAFWPEHTHVVHRSDEDTAVLLGAGERSGTTAEETGTGARTGPPPGIRLTHGALRAGLVRVPQLDAVGALRPWDVMAGAR